MAKLIERCILLLCGAVLASCVSLDVATRNKALQLDAPEAFHAIGKASVSGAGKGTFFAFAWIVNHQGEHLRITTPNGVPLARLERSAEKLVVEIHNKGRRVARPGEVDAVLSHVLGFALPYQSLLRWVVGVPEDQAPLRAAEFDKEGRLTFLKQSGWEVNYLGYSPAPGSGRLPRLLRLSQGSLTLTVAVSRWQMPGSAWVRGEKKQCGVLGIFSGFDGDCHETFFDT